MTPKNVDTDSGIAKQRRDAELKRLAALSDDEIDTSDIPERQDWSRTEVGKFYAGRGGE